jgi:hypothetical protein
MTLSIFLNRTSSVNHNLQDMTLYDPPVVFHSNAAGHAATQARETRTSVGTFITRPNLRSVISLASRFPPPRTLSE